MSSSLINAATAGSRGISLFSNTAGVVYAPGDDLSMIKCVYGGDGGSRKEADGCGENWCQTRNDAWCGGRPPKPWQPADVLRSQRPGTYNEVILDASYLDWHLPRIVEAVFYLAGDSGSFDAAKLARAAFVDKYSLDPEQFPLLSLDVQDVEQPFRQTDREP